MDNVGIAVAVIGALLVVGLVADWVAARTPVPRVSALILLGLLVGPSGLDLLPPDRETWFPVVSAIALVMVGFLIGSEFTADRLRESGRRAMVISAVEALSTATVVGVGLLVLGVDLRLALPLAGIAVATDVAAVAGVIEEQADRGPFARLLRAVVGVDDALGLVVFSLLMVIAGIVAGSGTGSAQHAVFELGGGILVGVALGAGGAVLTGRLQPGRPILEEALGLMLLCAGLGLWLGVSYLLAAVVMGAMVANLAQHHDHAFREIEGIEWPFLVLFFVLAGASLQLGAVPGVGLAAAGYIALRTVGKVVGAWLGSRSVAAPTATARWVGPALLPQAGVALGLALLVQNQLPDVGADVVAVVIASTVVFELVGPLVTRAALARGS